MWYADSFVWKFDNEIKHGVENVTDIPILWTLLLGCSLFSFRSMWCRSNVFIIKITYAFRLASTVISWPLGYISLLLWMKSGACACHPRNFFWALFQHKERKMHQEIEISLPLYYPTFFYNQYLVRVEIAVLSRLALFQVRPLKDDCLSINELNEFWREMRKRLDFTTQRSLHFEGYCLSTSSF